jgi:hypothetical protein
LSGILGYPNSAVTIADRLARLLSRAGEVVLVAELAPRGVVGWINGAEQERSIQVSAARSPAWW